MNNYYTISAKDNIVLYGGGTLGKERYHYFSGYYHVIAFFDRNAASITMEGIDIPIYFPQEGISKLGHDIIVIICIHNALIHQEVAQSLYSLGINKIIFIPMGDCYLPNFRIQMLEIYTFCCEQNVDKILEIPYYSAMLRPALSDCIIRRNNEYVVSWCPIELLFTDRDWPDENGNIPMTSFRAMAEGYEFFQGQIETADKFIKVYMPEDGQSDNVEDFLQRRYNTYLMLEKEWKETQEYFKYAPIEVKWNEKAYFNVQDGHNRACFLIGKGCKWVPVRMHKEDYESWLNFPVYKTFFEKNGESIEGFAYHLPHPCFKHEKITEDDFCVDILREAFKYLGKEIKKIENVLEISEYEGYFASNFVRMGIKHAVVLEDREEKIGRINRIQELIQVESLHIAKDICYIWMKIELAFILKKIRGKDLEGILKADSFMKCKYLFLKSNKNEEEIKKILYKYGYSKYQFLFRVIEGGEVREIGIYSRSVQ